MAKKKKLPVGFSERANGLLQYRFTMDKKRYTVYGATVKECRQKELEKRKQVQDGIYKKASKLTVSEYFDRWIANKQGTVKETTIRTDTILLSRMKETPIDKAGTLFGNLKLAAVDVQNVRDLQKALQEKLRTKDKDGKEVIRKGMTTRAANDSIYLLKAVFKSAMLIDRIIQFNPVEGVKPLKRTEEQARDTIHRALTRQETSDFLTAAKDSHYYNLYVFLLNTGCRLGEAGALMIGDVSKNNVKISRTITRTEVGGYEIGIDAKTEAGKRTIPMNEEAQQAWKAQKDFNSAIDGAISISDPVFRAPRGSLIKSANVNADIAKICEKAGIDRFSAHAFRDTFATRCVESNMQVKTLQVILGHTDVSMTLGLYAHVMEDQKIEQLKAVNFT